MVIRGKAIFAAQTALTSASDAYLTVSQQRISQQNHTNRLRKAIPQIQGSNETLTIIKIALAERLLAVRSWIVLDFRQYVASYAWDCLNDTQPIVVDPMKDIASFRNDAATLQALAAQVPPIVRAQKRIFHLFSNKNTDTLDTSTKSGMVHSEDFLDVLKDSRTASFMLDCENPMFQKYGRLRVRVARIYLEGLGNTNDHAISLRVTLGASMKDLGLNRPQVPTMASGNDIAPRVPAVLQFVTTETTFGFEYIDRGKEVLMDGEFSRSHNSSLLLSPFRTWTMTVDSQTDIQSVTGIKLELVCDVTYL
jgi:hypothetical protein